MRIALDLRYRTTSGASTYIRNLAPRLLTDSRHEYVLVIESGKTIPGVDVERHESIQAPPMSKLRQVLWDQTSLPAELARRGIDLYHPMKLLGTLSHPCPQVTVLHSITLPYHGDEFPNPAHVKVYWNTIGKHLYWNSTRIVAVSEYVKSFGIDILGIPADRITVIHHGRDLRFQRADIDRRSLGLDFDGPFVLTVGNLYPHKNHRTAILAFARIAAQFPQHRLVMAGNMDHPYFRQIRETVSQSGVASRIHLLGLVDQDRLVGLYNHADLMLMSSLAEGFGIALVEALGCGTPVIGAGRGALADVGGKGIHIVPDPFDIEAWARATALLLESPGLRAELGLAALERAETFTWEATTRQHLELYDQVGSDIAEGKAVSIRRIHAAR